MSTTQPLKSAVPFLRQVSAPPTGRDARSARAAVPAAASGVAVSSVAGSQPQAEAPKAEATVSELDFAGRDDIQRMKVDIMRHLGAAVGLALKDYASLQDFGRAVRDQINATVTARQRENPDEERDFFGEQAKAHAALEKDLGFQRRGISIEDILGAAESPRGEADARLEAAVRQAAAPDTDQAKSPSFVKIDEIGVYTIADAPAAVRAGH